MYLQLVITININKAIPNKAIIRSVAAHPSYTC